MLKACIRHSPFLQHSYYLTKKQGWNINNKKLLIGYKLPLLDKLDVSNQTKTFVCIDLLTSMLYASSSDFYKEMIDNKYVSSLGVDILQYPKHRYESFCSSLY